MAILTVKELTALKDKLESIEQEFIFFCGKMIDKTAFIKQINNVIAGKQSCEDLCCVLNS